MAVIGCMKEFDVNQPISWEKYSEQLKFFLKVISITDVGKWRATLLAVIGARTLSIIHSLILLDLPSEKNFDELLQLIKTLFATFI